MFDKTAVQYVDIKYDNSLWTHPNLVFAAGNSKILNYIKNRRRSTKTARKEWSRSQLK